MTTATDGRRVQQPNRWLDAAVVSVSAIVLLSIASFGTPPSGLTTVGGALAVFIGTWFTVGRRVLNGGPGWSVVAVVLVAVCAVSAWVTPGFATFQLVAFPLAWLITPGIRSALITNVAVAVAIGVGYALGTSVVEAVAVEGVSLAFSLAMGVWISRIEERSASRLALIDELTAAQAQLAALHHDAGAVAERERLARELHDTLTQSLAGITMLAERARSRHPDDAALGVLEDAARQAMSEARGLVTAGAPVPLEGGLAAALDTLAARFRRETGLEVSVDVRAEVPRDLEVVLLRCAQEGLANVRKHAAAGAVALRVGTAEERAVLTVEDDGLGPSGGDGFGIAGMRDRLALVAGDVSLGAAATGGALLTVRVPLPVGAS